MHTGLSGVRLQQYYDSYTGRRHAPCYTGVTQQVSLLQVSFFADTRGIACAQAIRHLVPPHGMSVDCKLV
jgi:hypothetical protein